METSSSVCFQIDTIGCHISYICPNWTVIIVSSRYKFMFTFAQNSTTRKFFVVLNVPAANLQYAYKVNSAAVDSNCLDNKIAPLKFVEGTRNV
jgi:hypothetical protein